VVVVVVCVGRGGGGRGRGRRCAHIAVRWQTLDAPLAPPSLAYNMYYNTLPPFLHEAPL